MDETKITWVGDMTKVNLCPGDVIVLTFSGNLPEDVIKRIYAKMDKDFPHNKTLILENGLRMGVLGVSHE